MSPLFARLAGPSPRPGLLLASAALVLLAGLGGRDLWTQEQRWAEVCRHMIETGDYWHPVLDGRSYYDKPLLSYWTMVLAGFLLGGLTETSLRLPSALAGLATVYGTYRLGCRWHGRPAGLLAGWMLASTWFFLFWARTASADALSLAGIVLALAWWFERAERPGFVTDFVFLSIGALTSLFKGLVGAVVPILAVLPHLTRRDVRPGRLATLVPAAIPALALFLLPFWASRRFGDAVPGEDGLFLVWRENFVRYFAPFDHQDPFLYYFLWLPAYLLPWTPFLLGALVALPTRWPTLDRATRGLVGSTLLVFAFFVLSGSRRPYYILPVVPLAILITAEWMAADASGARGRWAGRLAALSLVGAVGVGGLLLPLAFGDGGPRPFAEAVRGQAERHRPWPEWRVVSIEAREHLSFYLRLPKPPLRLARDAEASVVAAADGRTLFLGRRQDLFRLRRLLPTHSVVEARPPRGDRWLGIDDPDLPIALLPMAPSGPVGQ